MLKNKEAIPAGADKLNILSVVREERSSRFVVDLKKTIAEGRIDKKNISKKSFFERAAGFNLRNFFQGVKIFPGDFLSFLKNLSCDKEKFLQEAEELLEASKLPSETKKSLVASSRLAVDWYDIYGETISQLAFFSLGRLLIIFIVKAGKLFYKICYGLGWFCLFLIRLINLFLQAIFGFATIGLDKFYSGLKFAVQVFCVNLKALLGQSFATSKIFFEKLFGGMSLFFKKVLSCGKKSAEAVEYDNQEDDNDFFFGKEAVVNLKFSWQRSMLTFIIALLVIISPFKIFAYYKSLDLESLKGKILGASEIAVGDLAVAGKSAIELDFSQASHNFSRAGDSFLKAQEQLAEINDLIFALASLVPSEEIKLAGESKKILAIGQTASKLGSDLSLAVAGLFNNKNKGVLAMLNSFTDDSGQAVIEAIFLNDQLNEININALPAEYREKFLLLQKEAKILEEGLIEFVDLAGKLKDFLGANQNKRYLLVFQNNAELRASGGFIGSFALVDFQDGKIKNIEVPEGGSYDTEGGLRELVTAPAPLHLVNSLWHFWDANWWPDWPTSAQKLMWFYERSDGPTVDGVISFTPTVLEKLLAIIGPVDMSKDYGVTLTADNFWITTQTIVEAKPKKGEENTSKKIIAELLDKIITDLPANLDKDKLIKLLSLADESLSERHILFYFVDKELQQEIEKQGWGGRMRETARDYLSVINTNIAGGKSDRKIKETIKQTAEIMPDGSIINTVEIVRKHAGINREPFCGVRNVNWLRVYVPAGSELLEARGFRQPDGIYFEEPDESWTKDPVIYQEETISKIHEASGTRIYEEEGKTVFANWSMVDPGENTIIYLKYKLPFVLEEKEEVSGLISQLKELIVPGQSELFPYTLLVQKQSGSLGSEINSSLKLPDNFEIVWQYQNSLASVVDGWNINDKLNTDKYWAALLEKQ